MAASQPRTWQSKGFIPFRLEVLSPVYIGSGDTLSPLEYVIRKQDAKARLYRIDLQRWLMDHAADQSVQHVIATDDLSRIRHMLDEKLDERLYALSSSPIEDLALADELLSAFTVQQNTPATPARRQNAEGTPRGKTGDVDAALRNPVDNCLYIPGSSLKGAISTPIINWLDGLKKRGQETLKDAHQKDPKQGMNSWLKEMFGPIDAHAMQALKVSDVTAPFASCAVVRAKGMRRQETRKKDTPKNPCEAIMPGCGDMWGRLMLDSAAFRIDDRARFSDMWGRLMLDSAAGTPCITLPQGEKLTLPNIIRHCNEFYGGRFIKEFEKFYTLPHFREVRAAVQQIKAKLMALDHNTMLLRVGHYSHVECVTVENHLPFTRKGKNNTPLPFGTTRTLANGKAPFGWVLLHFCPMEEYEKGMAEAESQRTAAVAAQMQQRDAIRRKFEARAEQAAALAYQQEKQRLAAAQKAAEEKRRQEELARRMADLSPEEALLLKLTVEPSEALATEIYRAMTSWRPDLQGKAAEALRDYWMSLGKWSGKQSEKQTKKVKEVTALLT